MFYMTALEPEPLWNLFEQSVLIRRGEAGKD